MRKNNRGFTLVEMVIVVSIFAVLLGIMVPSLNSIIRFKGQKTTESVMAALDKTKTEAMSRLVGEMKLFKDADGNYCISYFLSRGKNSGVVPDQAEVIAKKNSKIHIKYCTSASPGDAKPLDTNGITLTYDRDTGGFRDLQSKPVESGEYNNDFWEEKAYADLNFWHPVTAGVYCSSIIVYRGDTPYRTITLDAEAGTYKVS